MASKFANARLVDMNTLKRIDDYPAYLESCWLEHLQPKPQNAPKVISTFAGAGGSSLGYSMAGFRELLAVEWDNNAVETFKLNFPDVPVYHGDIAKLSVDECLRLANIQPGELDIFDGSPPCQGFSTAGKRKLSDSRNQLFREYVRLLRGLRPKVFVMENVSGMVKGVMKIVFAEIMRELKASGYQVSARLLNAMYFGVPQSRQRMIFIGVREDLGIEPSHPEAETEAVKLKNAWHGIENEKGIAPSGQLLELVKILPEGASNGSGKYSKQAYGKSQFFGVNRLCWEETSPTIIKTYQRVFHPLHNAPPSTMQTKRIGSFPDSFVFAGKDGDIWMRIGNSVPPLFMQSIARHIKSNILDLISNGQ